MATISEDYVSFETANLLKEKGFDEGCHSFYDYAQRLQYIDTVIYDSELSEEDNECVAPTLQMTMKWLREVHNIVIGVNVGNENNKDNTDYCNPDRWWYFWEFTDTRGVYREELQPNPLSNEYKSYEEAADAAIKYCLENLI